MMRACRRRGTRAGVSSSPQLSLALALVREIARAAIRARRRMRCESSSSRYPCVATVNEGEVRAKCFFVASCEPAHTAPRAAPHGPHALALNPEPAYCVQLYPGGCGERRTNQVDQGPRHGPRRTGTAGPRPRACPIDTINTVTRTRTRASERRTAVTARYAERSSFAHAVWTAPAAAHPVREIADPSGTATSPHAATAG